ncbi:hypothetical protein ABBQ38_014318 [Trebouxia sp. C0009 RCD-2024]
MLRTACSCKAARRKTHARRALCPTELRTSHNRCLYMATLRDGHETMHKREGYMLTLAPITEPTPGIFQPLGHRQCSPGLKHLPSPHPCPAADPIPSPDGHAPLLSNRRTPLEVRDFRH